MRLITWQSNPAWLLDIAPNWADPVELVATWDVRISQGETGREERTPMATDPVLSLTYKTLSSGVDVPALRNALQTFRTEPVLCPLWPARRVWNTYHPVSSNWWCIFEPLRTPYVVDAIPSRCPDGTRVCPLMVGRLNRFPEPTAPSNELLAVAWEFVEDSVETITVRPFEWEVGPATPRGETYLFPFRQNSRDNPDTQIPQWNLHEEQIGHGRTSVKYVEPQPTRRMERAAFWLRQEGIWKFLRWWSDRRGPWQSFWFAGGINETRLTADIAPNATALPVANPSAIGANTFVLVQDASKRTTAQVTGTTGSNWNLADDVGAHFDRTRTVIWPLQLSRLARNQVSIQFEHEGLAKADLEVTEVPWEIVMPVGESTSSLGSAPTKTYFYTFRAILPTGNREWRYTNHATAVDWDGVVSFEHASINHGAIRQSLGLDSDDVTITSAVFPGNPLLEGLPVGFEFPMEVEISEVSMHEGGNTAYALFHGKIRKVKRKGAVLSVTASSMGGLGMREFPRRKFGIRCNWQLFDEGCGLNPVDWQWTGTVSAWNASTSALTINNFKKNGVTVTAGSLEAHLFAGGYIQIGAAASMIPRWVTDSAAPTAGAIVVTLSKGFVTAPTVGTAVTLQAGCDLRAATCADRFANSDRFGGFPNMVIGNPVIARIKTAGSGGGKK